MPLVRNGVVIEHFSMTFRDGRIVDFSAEKGYDTLKEIISTDEGAHYLGEIALVGYHSPIRALNTLFTARCSMRMRAVTLRSAEGSPPATGAERR